MGSGSSIPWGPYFERKDFKDIIDDMKEQEEYIKTPLTPVHEVLIHTFIHPKDPSNPASITTGVLTGGEPLWAFTVGEQYGHGELYYYVYDTKVIDHREDGTWVVEHANVVLVKAQIAVEGYKPELKDMLRSSMRVFGGYTKFTPGMIHRASQTLLKFRGCMHVKMPFVGESHDHNLASSLLDIICDHRVRPPMKMPITLGEGENMVQIGLPGRLIDYYPKVEFVVWRKDHCPENELPETERDKEAAKIAQQSQTEGPWDWPEGIWPVTDTLFHAKQLHEKEHQTKLIDNEALLQGWSEKAFSSDETRKAWKQANKKNSLTSLTQRLGLS